MSAVEAASDWDNPPYVKEHWATAVLILCQFEIVRDHLGMRATTLISKSKPASQFTPTAVQFG